MQWRGLSLFSGIGGLDLAFEWAGGKVSAMCEIEPFCRKVLRKHWPNVPLFEDVRELKGSDVGAVDIIYGGFPCQPFSVAGNKKGKDDSRYMWPEFSRLVGEIRPRWIVAENVPGILHIAVDDGLNAPIWSVKVTKLGFGILKLRLSEQNTEGKEFSLWRTPTAHDYRGANSQENYERRQREGLPLSLNDQVAHMLPTPTRFDATCGDLKGKEYTGKNRHSMKLIQAVKLLPTPIANDAKNNGSQSRFKRHTLSLDAVAGGSLNPVWIEWLMGFQTGWTDLKH